MNKFLFTDTNGKKSVTVTVFVLGSILVSLKLVFSGIAVGGVTLAPFTGGEFAAAIGALGGIYVIRRNADK